MKPIIKYDVSGIPGKLRRGQSRSDRFKHIILPLDILIKLTLLHSQEFEQRLREDLRSCPAT